jgi:hypothetical protein
MKTLSLIALTLTLSAIGCASEPTTASLTSDHPAHVDAKQAACCDKSATLATSATGPTTKTGKADPHAAHAGHAADADHSSHAASKADAPREKPIAYPLSVCLVADEDLNAMGKPYGFVHEGRQIMLCCKACEKEFKQNTAKYIKKFDDAVKAK